MSASKQKDAKDAGKSSSYRAQQRTIDDLTLGEKLETVPVLASVAANTLVALVTGLYRPTGLRKTGYSQYVKNTTARTFTRKASCRLQNYLITPTDRTYEKICKKRKVQPRSVVLEDGTRAHWIGREVPETVIVNFHGGGYTLPAMPEMFQYYFQLVAKIELANKSASVLFLSYDNSPGATFPRQLAQAVALLDHLLHTLHYPPSSIILTGDSAGGNLLLALLSHISHPHPLIPPLHLASPLSGAVLLSPWVSFSTQTPSFAKNHYLDCISPRAVDQYTSAFLGAAPTHSHSHHDEKARGGAPRDNYSEPILADEDWWKGTMVREVLIVFGGDERLGDGIRDFAAKFRGGFVREFEGRGEVTTDGIKVVTGRAVGSQSSDSPVDSELELPRTRKSKSKGRNKKEVEKSTSREDETNERNNVADLQPFMSGALDTAENSRALETTGEKSTYLHYKPETLIGAAIPRTTPPAAVAANTPPVQLSTLTSSSAYSPTPALPPSSAPSADFLIDTSIPLALTDSPAPLAPAPGPVPVDGSARFEDALEPEVRFGEWVAREGGKDGEGKYENEKYENEQYENEKYEEGKYENEKYDEEKHKQKKDRASSETEQADEDTPLLISPAIPRFRGKKSERAPKNAGVVNFAPSFTVGQIHASDGTETNTNANANADGQMNRKTLTIVEVPNEFHLEMFVDWQTRENRECVMGKGVKEWILRRL